LAVERETKKSRIDHQIENIEEKMIGEKSWQMKGEIKSV
jgi:U3 small nucleolar ribonucleoprotein component